MKARHETPQTRQGYGIPAIPSTVRDFYGFEVDLTGKRWCTFRNPERRGRVTFNVDLLRRPLDRSKPLVDQRFQRRQSVLSPALINAIELFIIERIRTHTPLGSRAVINGFIHMEKYIAEIYRWGERNVHKFYASDITFEFVTSFNRWIRETVPENGKYISFIKTFYDFSLSRNFRGFHPSVLSRITRIEVAIPPKGHLARFRDPAKGSFIWQERIQIRKCLDERRGSDRDRAIVGLFDETGIRAEAAIRIRARHVHFDSLAGVASIDVPRVKQRKATIETRNYPLTSELGLLLKSVIRKNAPDDFLLHWLSDVGPTNDIITSMNRWSQEVGLTTLRLNDGTPTQLPLTPYRFRRTMATILAEQGADAETIAAKLDDASLAMALVYASNSSSIVDILRDTLDRHPAWRRLIRLYLGQPATMDDSNKLPAIIGGLFHFVNAETHADLVGVIGWCSSRKKCSLFPPLSCYKCPEFRANMTLQPHERQLEQIRDELERLTGVESDRAVLLLKNDIFAIQSAIADIREYLGRESKSDPRIKRTRMLAAEKLVSGN